MCGLSPARRISPCLRADNGHRWPADVYLEGPDQYRGWFQSSLLVGVGTRGGAPYREVVTHGWTLDEKGAPMSKSLGNAIYPDGNLREKWGADLLRIWVVSQDYTADVRISEAMMTQLAEAYRKIRNTFRFALTIFTISIRRAIPWPTPNCGKWTRGCSAALANCSRASAANGTTNSNFTASITRCTISARWT